MSEMEWTVPGGIYEAAIVRRTKLQREWEREQEWRRALLTAALDVIQYDWSDNDEDSVASIERLRHAITPPPHTKDTP